MRRNRAALVIPLVEMAEIRQEHDRLDRVEPGRVALDLVLVLRTLAVLAKRANLRRHLLVVRRQRAGVTERTEVLARIKAECGCLADRARSNAVPLGAVRLA